MDNKIQQIEDNYKEVLGKIAETAQIAGRDLESIKLVIVTKGRPLPFLEVLYKLGARDFGENRVFEAIEKIRSFSSSSSVQWHMIGQVQSRKASPVLEHFNLLHSLDRIKLANRLNSLALERKIKFPVLLQFNVSGEKTKSGWLAHEEKAWPNLLTEIEQIVSMPNLVIKGLMTMAPYGGSQIQNREIFSRLRQLKGFLAQNFPNTIWDELSMGMSADYKDAIMEGATLLRIGTSILGSV